MINIHILKVQYFAVSVYSLALVSHIFIEFSLDIWDCRHLVRVSLCHVNLEVLLVTGREPSIVKLRVNWKHSIMYRVNKTLQAKLQAPVFTSI